MATKRHTDPFQALRAAGLRKKVAHAVTDATRKTRRGKQSKLLVKTIENLTTAVAEIERRTAGNTRTDAARRQPRLASAKQRRAAQSHTRLPKPAQIRKPDKMAGDRSTARASRLVDDYYIGVVARRNSWPAAKSLITTR